MVYFLNKFFNINKLFTGGHMNNKAPIKVLIIDDDPFIQKMIQSFLVSKNYVTQTASNGKLALEIIQQDSSFDLILSDMVMPEINGLQLIQAIRTMKNEIPIIIMTGNSEIKIALSAIREGANDYLLKDENLHDTILFSLERVLEKEQLKKENILLLSKLKEKNKELERLSFIDGLTCIANRRHFDMLLEQEWRRATRKGFQMALLMVDIDFFKKYNDMYGHQEGDICLKQVARALSQSVLRGGDCVARYGGEEFAAILPHSNLMGAEHVAKKMIQNVSTLKIPHEGSNISNQITISIGYASIFPTKLLKNPTTLIQQADHALYHAKKEGRNQAKAYQSDI